MTLERQIDLVNQLVKKEPETTIKEYLELVADLDRIEKIFEKESNAEKATEPYSNHSPYGIAS